jgi:hypothetical protein
MADLIFDQKARVGEADVDYGDYVIGVRSIRDHIRQTFALWKEHWAEQGEAAARSMECAPDLAQFLAGEDSGWFRYVAVMHGDELVGHFGLSMGVSKNTSRKVAGDDFFFISKPHRHGMLGVKLVKFARDLAGSEGASEFSVSYRTFGSVDLDVMLRRCGLVHRANVYSLSFTEG